MASCGPWSTASPKYRKALPPDPDIEAWEATGRSSTRGRPVCFFSLGPSPELWREVAAMMREAVARGTPDIDERELARRLGWTDEQYEEMRKQRSDPTVASWGLGSTRPRDTLGVRAQPRHGLPERSAGRGRRRTRDTTVIAAAATPEEERPFFSHYQVHGDAVVGQSTDRLRARGGDRQRRRAIPAL